MELAMGLHVKPLSFPRPLPVALGTVTWARSCPADVQRGQRRAVWRWLGVHCTGCFPALPAGLSSL